MIKEQACGVRSCCSGFGGCKVCHLGESVDKHHYCIKSSLGLGELNYEIHGYLFPGMRWNSQGLKKSTRYLLTGFDALARITRLDIFLNIVVHLGPVEHAMDSCICSFNALVSCN